MKRNAFAATILVTALAGASARAQDESRSAAEVERRAPEREPRRHPVRAVLEAGLFLVANTAYYWWDKDLNAPDWELGWNWPSWKKKLVTFEAVRLDANEFSTNAATHTQAGAVIYLIGRGNGLSAGESLLLTTGESIVWEYLAEFREKVSINDLLTNPLGGFAVGETFVQLSDFFARGADNGVNRAIAAVFSPLSAVNGNHSPRAGKLDDLGFPADTWHRFDLQTGLSNSRFDEGSQTETTLRAGGAVNTVRGYSRGGARPGFFGVGRMVSLDLGLGLGARGMTAALFATRVALAGYHHGPQSASGDGASVLLALMNSFEYTNRSRPGMALDQIASFGVAGPAGELAYRQGDFQARLHLEGTPDLAMVTALANDRYRQVYGTEGLKSVLAQRGYYFGYGLTFKSGFSLQYGAWAAGVDSRWERFGSVEGVDRYQERITNDFHVVDRRLATQGWLSLRPTRYGVIALSLEGSRRSGEMLDLETAVDERRAAVTLGLAF